MINKIGLDKIHIKLNQNITTGNKTIEIIEGIDMSKLNEAKQLHQDKINLDTSYNISMIKDIKTNKKINLKYLSIRDDILFDSFRMYSFEMKGFHHIQVEFDLFVMNNNNNMLPKKISEVKEHYKRVIKHLKEQYGIYLNPNVILLECIEINSTFQLEHEYSYYNYLLELLYKLAPRTFNKCINVTTFYLNNNSVAIKTYNKSEQLKDKIENFDIVNLIRFEYTLKTRKKVNEVFGTYDLSKITDEQIQDFFKKSIQKDFLNLFEKHIKTSNKLIQKFTDEAVAENTTSRVLKSKWISSFIIKSISRSLPAKLNQNQIQEINQIQDCKFVGEATTSFDIQVLIDKEQILRQIKRIYGSNSSRYIKQYKKELDELKKYFDTFKKYTEIKEKLLQNQVDFDEVKK
ncbi:hypothetical protein DAF96_18605 [Clostridioides difficile]|nr:hypothetical protein [Clostridioides difficile]